MNNRVSYLLTALLFVFAAGNAKAGLITFEEFGAQPGLFDLQESLDTEYSSIGVNFSGGWEILDEQGGFGVSARSGEHFAAYNIGVGITDTITMSFDNIINQASGFLGDGTQSNWVVTAWLNGNQASILNLTNTAGNYVEFDFNGLMFDRVTIQGSGRHAVIDDISFGVTQVPEPSTLAIFALSIFGLTSRKFKK